MTGITIALSKGRIFDETAPLLKAAGIVALDNPEKSRKLQAQYFSWALESEH